MNILLLSLYLLNAFVMLAAPILLGFYLSRRFKFGWRLWWIGAATFILSQVGHIPFNLLVGRLVSPQALSSLSAQSQLIVQALFLGLSAGVFEEGARYATYRWWARDARSWSKGLMLGAGHGGIEAIILGVLVLVNIVAMVAIRSLDLSTMVPADQLALAQQQVNAFWSANWYDTLLGAMERLFAITVQLSLSILVLQVFTRFKLYWLWIAIAWHALVDAASVYLAQTTGVYVTELALGVFALVSLAIIFRLRQPEEESGAQPEPEPTQPPDSTTLTGQIPPAETDDKLHDSRYL